METTAARELHREPTYVVIVCKMQREPNSYSPPASVMCRRRYACATTAQITIILYSAVTMPTGAREQLSVSAAVCPDSGRTSVRQLTPRLELDTQNTSGASRKLCSALTWTTTQTITRGVCGMWILTKTPRSLYVGFFLLLRRYITTCFVVLGVSEEPMYVTPGTRLKVVAYPTHFLVFVNSTQNTLCNQPRLLNN